jgi:serine/threonine-protein kinase
MELEPKKRPQSMQAWLKLLEIPTVLTPPPVHEQEFFHPSANQTSRQRFRTASTRKARTILWVGLLVIAGCYLVIGFFSVKVGAGTMAVAGVAGVIAVAVAVAGGLAGAMAGAVAGGLAVGSVAWDLADVAALAAIIVAPVAGAGAGAVAGDKLQESFSKFHTFLIWLGTSWLGLGLGWLLGSIF